MSDSLWLRGLYSPWNSPGQNIAVGSLSLFRGIFPSFPGIEPRSPELQGDSLPAEPKGKPKIILVEFRSPPSCTWTFLGNCGPRETEWSYWPALLYTVPSSLKCPTPPPPACSELMTLLPVALRKQKPSRVQAFWRLFSRAVYPLLLWVNSCFAGLQGLPTPPCSNCVL